MNKLDQLLFKISPAEHEQLRTNAFVQDIPSSAQTSLPSGVQLNAGYFFRNQDIFISKHNRFADYPLHSHKFLELNYMYAGSCTQIVNGHTIHLHTGDVLLMDIGTSHTIHSLGEQDILMNVLFQNKSLNLDWLATMSSASSIAFNIFYQQKMAHHEERQFRIFHSQPNDDTRNIMYRILSEYYFPEEYSKVIITNFLPILLIDLMRIFRKETIAEQIHDKDSVTIRRILKIIERDYMHTSLQKVAQECAYNKNYLSNFIHRQTGFTFTELLNRQRLLRAHELIISSQIPIARIAENVGFSSRTYFYQTYQQYYHELPRTTRIKKLHFIPINHESN
ncbi:AraC transcriptional regulator [Furfurilactobacillus rossiae]|uniref:helix-turn-helix domain-containing protein n=1 Tax=Furfurilactobacillus rossiae TaxID=231049 RepID=UPI0015C12881|nr:helix-turn-helix domain-containing protein [Furfurilactobacillus rossiae]MCF6165746.1 helix-turn-helix domain-containing protein [Furfurilactobacillus rossiae]QLE63131.1 AraC transcriptional regulator [Furfurilactobacillus rossiae]